MRMRTQKRKTLLLHSARLHTVAIGVLTNVTPPPLLTFVYFCKGAVAGDVIAAALPLGSILAAHRTDPNRSTVRRFFVSTETRLSVAVETQIYVRRQILLSYVAHKFICREKSIFPVCL